jgi:uncharacterized membrane protein (Fun14 family)
MKQEKYEWRLKHTPDSIGPLAATIGGGFFAGILIGYAMKKVVKVVACYRILL